MAHIPDDINLDKVLNDINNQLHDIPLSSSNEMKYTNKPTPILNDNTSLLLHQDPSESIILQQEPQSKSKFDNLFTSSSNPQSNPSNKPSGGLKVSDLKNTSNLLKPTSSFLKDEYLSPTDWKSSSDSNIMSIEHHFSLISKSINTTELYQLYSSIQNCSLSKASPDTSPVGPISTLEHLVETQFYYDQSKVDQMSFHIVELEPYVLRWRHINGDGNCFYRAMIFSFLEHIIISNNIVLLKEIIIEINEKFSKDYSNAQYIPFIKGQVEKIDKKIIIAILLLICEAMDISNPQMNPYEMLLRCFIFCPKFDHGMVFYLRFILFEFIKANWNKVYSKEFSVKLGNLLPVEYETAYGDFLYDKFYEENLCMMDVHAEKIVIYLTPLVLRCDLNIIIYDFDSEDAVSYAKFSSFLGDKPRIELLFRKAHYDLVYGKSYYNDNIKKLNYFLNVKQNQKVLTVESIDKVRDFHKKSMENKQRLGIASSSIVNINSNSKDVGNDNDPFKAKDNSLPKCLICHCEYIHRQNVLSICLQCLLSELSSQIYGFYLQYLHDARETWDKSKCTLATFFDESFRGQNCFILNQAISITFAAEMANKTLVDIIKDIKAKLCIQCQNNIDTYHVAYFTLPCSCVICSKECFTEYFNEFLIKDLDEAKEREDYATLFDSCLCGYQFNFNDYVELYRYFDKRDLKKLKKTMKEVVMKNFLPRCLSCLNVLSEKMVRLTLKDEKIKEIFNEKEFYHMMCYECYGKFGNGKVIECLHCNNVHKVVKVKEIYPRDDYDRRHYYEDDDDDGCMIV